MLGLALAEGGAALLWKEMPLRALRTKSWYALSVVIPGNGSRHGLCQSRLSKASDRLAFAIVPVSHYAKGLDLGSGWNG